MDLLILVIVFAMLVVLAALSQRWGVDSRDTVESREWLYRRNYPRHHL